MLGMPLKQTNNSYQETTNLLELDLESSNKNTNKDGTGLDNK